MVRKRTVGVGFSADWLTLREPADQAARDDALLQHALELVGANPVLMDLGCGTGSTVRTMAPALPGTATWRLVDNDPLLLERALESAGEGSTGHLLDIDQLASLPLEGVTLVTASALLDLVTEEWLGRLSQVLKVPFYAALSYNGEMCWDPVDPRDQAVTEAFNRHQRQDKGLGPALGPTSVVKTIEVFEAAGFIVLHGDSPWQLAPESSALQQALVAGIAQAASEAAGEPDEMTAQAWGETRVAQATQTQCVIGHGDLLIIPVGMNPGTMASTVMP